MTDNAQAAACPVCAAGKPELLDARPHVPIAQNLMYRWRCEDAADGEKHDAIETSPESQGTEASGSSDGRLLRHIRFRTIWPLGQEFHPTWGSESEADHRDVSLPES